MFSRTILRAERHMNRDRREDFLRKHLAGIASVDFPPRLVSKNPGVWNGDSKECSENNDKRSRWKVFLVRNDWHVKHLHRWNFFHFLDLRHLIFFGERLEHCFLNLRSAVKVRVRDAEEWQFPDGRIHGLAWLGGDSGRTFAFPPQLFELDLQFVDSRLHAPHTHVVVGINLFETLE